MDERALQLDSRIFKNDVSVLLLHHLLIWLFIACDASSKCTWHNMYCNAAFKSLSIEACCTFSAHLRGDCLSWNLWWRLRGFWHCRRGCLGSTTWRAALCHSVEPQQPSAGSHTALRTDSGSRCLHPAEKNSKWVISLTRRSSIWATCFWGFLVAGQP